MQFPEHLQQLVVADFFRLVDHEHDFGVPGQARADFFISRIRRETTGIPHHGADYAFTLPEATLRPPKATQAEDCKVDIGGERTQ
ncbi:hypothetical protein D3C87_1726250 [compost metagenome]